MAVVATADPAYTERKYAGGSPRAESYVFMQGHFFEGSTVDRSLEHISFRQVAGYLAPELAKQQYFPGRDLQTADLLLVVHWGATLPHTGVQEMTGQTSLVTDTANSIDAAIRGNLMGANASEEGNLTPLGALAALGDNSRTQLGFDRLEQISERAAGEMRQGDNLRLLGYAEELHRMRQASPFASAAEETLRHDLLAERYFIIVCAYDLRAAAGSARRPVWKMHLNISSPGNNFRTAMARMSSATVSLIGRSSDGVMTVRPTQREGKVQIAPLIILGEVRASSK